MLPAVRPRALYGALVLAAAALATPSVLVAGSPRAPRGPASPQDPRCDPLPAVRPREISLAVSLVSIPRAGGPTHQAGEVVDAPSRCAGPAHLCRAAPPAVLDQLYALARGRGLDRLRALPTGRNSPHYTRRELTIRWPGGRCEISDSARAPLPRAEFQTFLEVFNAVANAYAALP